MKTSKAVILAGGRGFRMNPLTEVIPKALIPIDGVPILLHQLRQLERLGVKEVLILTGYLADSIEKFCNTLSLSLVIKCVPSNPSNSPAERLIYSREEIGDHFLLIYCDNLVKSDEKIMQLLTSKGVMTFLIEPREEGNIQIRNNNRAVYNSGKRSSNYKYVEIGNINIQSNYFFEILEETLDLPKALEIFSNLHQCEFIKLDTSLVSVSNFNRFLKLQNGRKVIILDRDGVLIKRMDKRKYLTNWANYEPLIKNWKGLRELSDLDIDFVVATNQPGIAIGEVEMDFLTELHQHLAAELLNFGVRLLAVYVCPHHWDDNCECRKPKPGMLLKIIDTFQLLPENVLFIGDEDRDLMAAKAAGISGLLIGYNHTNPQVYSDIFEAVPHIKRFLKQI